MRPFDPLNLLAAKWRMWLHGHGRLESHIAEQVAYRAQLCSDCVAAGQCLGCGCPVPDKFYQTGQCSWQRWPRLMPWDQWRAWREDNDKPADTEQTQETVVQRHHADDKLLREHLKESLPEANH